jgi:hypothetical protein
MEIFQNGRFSSGGPVYQIGVKQSDGTYDIKVYDIMTKEQAEARLKSMGVKPAPAKTPAKTPAKKTAPDYAELSKKELEILMRGHGVELDRRRSKTKLLAEVQAYFKGK